MNLNVKIGDLYMFTIQGVLGGGRRTVSCHQLPASPSHCSAHCSALRPDSGFNSEAEAGSSGCSVGLYSGCLDHYGLDGPLVPLQEVSPSCLLLPVYYESLTRALVSPPSLLL